MSPFLCVHIIAEGPCVEALVYLSALSQGEEDLVQLQSLWCPLPAESEVWPCLSVAYLFYILTIPRMVHAFTCAGVLPTQYIKMSTFAGIGHVGHGYMKKGNGLWIDYCLDGC